MRQVIKKDRVRIGATLEAPQSRPVPTPSSHASSAELVRVEDQVVGVRLTCSCGEVTLLEFDFEGSPPSKTSEPVDPSTSPGLPPEVSA